MGNFLYNLMLTLVWVVLNQDYRLGSFLTGFFFAYFITRFFNRNLKHRFGWQNTWAAFLYFFRFTYEMIKANVQVAWIVLQPKLNIRPGIIKYKLKARTDPGVTLIANSITLTPGTLSLDVSDDRRFLFVHAINTDDARKTGQEIYDSLEQHTVKIFP